MGEKPSQDEQSFSESEARQAFLLQLSDALRPLSDPLEIQEAAMRVLGEQLNVDRVLYGSVDNSENHVISDNYVRGDFPKLVGLFPVSSFGEVTEWLRKGETIAVEDMNTDERLSEATRAAFLEAGVSATVGVPLVKGGHWVASFGVHHGTPRRWTNEEMGLVQETAERTWAAVERAKAEEALRLSEAKYRTLFDSIDEGFVVAELLFDEEGKPFDLLVLETNASFERLMQTATSSVGKRAREIFPNAEASWFEAYGRVIETGESLRFENYLAELDCWFDLYISRVGEAGSRRFAIVFRDITERKRQEANLAFLNKVSGDLERLTKVDEIMSSLGTRIGEHFRVQRCSFAEINEAAGEITVRHAWYREGYVDSVGFRTVRLHDFISEELSQAARAGEMMIVRDTRTDPRTNDAAYAPRNTRAFLMMPFLRDGAWRATLSIIDSEPRDWRDDEIELTRELTMRIWTRLERARAEEALRESQEQLAAEVQTMRDLYDSSTRLLGMSDLNIALEEILDSSIRLLGADFGNVQLYNAKHKVLELVTARGFHPEFIETFKFVSSDDNTACGRAARSSERIIVEDVEQDALYEPYRQDAAKADYRAVQSTPLIDRQGRLLGMLSTHFRAPHRPTEDNLRLLDLYVRQTVDFIVRARAEEALRRSEERLRLILESAHGFAIFTTDADGVINSWYASAAQVFGWNEAEILGQKCNVTFTPEDRAAGAPEQERETARKEGTSPDIRWHQRKDGSRVFINGVMHSLRDGQLNGFFKIGRDETAQRQAEEALREHQRQLQLLNETLEQKVQDKTAEVRQLASEHVKVTQRERQRISQILHDDLQQRLYAIQVQLSFLRDGLPTESETAQRETSDIEKELAEIVKIMRNLSIDLSPPILPGEGLSHAIEWLASRMREQYGLPIELQANGPFVVSNEELHVLLFNCVRELLFNVVKHAGASRAVVKLQWIDSELRIEVRDNGKGFQLSARAEPASGGEGLPQSLGLPTIRHQLNLFGGVMEIHSKPGDGAQVILIVPVASQGVLSSEDML